MKKLITLQVNGEAHELAIEPDESLLQVLRERLELVGPKKGCDSGGCGCCSVHVDGQVVYSCMMYAAGAQGKAITTTEGVGGGDALHPHAEFNHAIADLLLQRRDIQVQQLALHRPNQR